MDTPQPSSQEQDTNFVPRVQAILEDVLKRMGVEAAVRPRISVEEDGEVVVFALRTGEAHLLIGQRGSNLQALQHVVRVLVNAELADVPGVRDFTFLLDVNNYRKDREGRLRQVAERTLRRVRDTKQEVALKPMSSYERRVIHTHLSSEADITTESAGAGRDRHVVVKPLFAKDEEAVVSGSLVF